MQKGIVGGKPSLEQGVVSGVWCRNLEHRYVVWYVMEASREIHKRKGTGS